MYRDMSNSAKDKNSSSDNAKPEINSLLIHIEGAVKNPGLYELTLGSRVDDALQLAGGVTDKADTSLLNLAEILEDEQKIYVPEMGEMIDSPLITRFDNAGKDQGIQMKFPLNLNTATKEQLESLPGIGATRAQDIIDYRKRHGGFKKKIEIMNVRGIGEKTYEKIKDMIYV